MHTSLLYTKLFVPPPRKALVHRPRLTKILANSLDYSLTLVSAPAGYGKTTLVSAWLSETGLPSSWLSLDEGDNDPIRFLQYLLTALHKVVPAIDSRMLDMFQGMPAIPYNALMGLLMNELAEHAAANHDSKFILVLDDFHVIHAQPILDMLAFLLDHALPSWHVMLLSRADPSLPLSRLRARNQLLEIRAEQLRFTVTEVAVFLSDVMGLTPAAEDINAIETRTEGWIAGLQLAALSMQECNDVHTFVSTFSGSHAYIMDYLVEEVLSHQPEEIRSFLLRTSILERMCGPLCDAVMAAQEMLPGQEVLEYIEQRCQFVVPLDNERRWYRYHQLFKDVLNRRLEILFPQQVPELHSRASRWYEQKDFVYEAVRHARLAGDVDRVADLFERYGYSLLMRGEVTTLTHWLEGIEDYSQTRPWLAMQKAWVLLFAGHPERAGQVIADGERQVAALEPSAQVRTMQGSFSAARAHLSNMQGNPALAAQCARRALEFLPDGDDLSRGLRSVATSILGDASWINGDLYEARQAYQEAVRVGQAADNPHTVLMASAHLATISLELGQLHQAERIYAETLQMITRQVGPDLPYAGKIYFGLSSVYYEWNRLEDAAQYVQKCIRLCQQWGDFDLETAGYTILAAIELARGNFEKTQAAIQTAEQLLSAHPLFPRWSMWIETALARLWLRQGNPEKAIQFVRNSGLPIDPTAPDALPGDAEIPYRWEGALLTLVRVHLAEGHPDAALALAERLLELAETTRRMGRVKEVLALQALAFQEKKDLPLALAALDRAIALAQPERSMRMFLDEGEPMVKLLSLARAHRIGGGFATELLSVVALPTQNPADDQALPEKGASVGFEAPREKIALVEPLSARELEVLRWIDAGYSNQEIAARFVISVKTVKRHISNIYGKLGVKTRTQAVSVGRALKLL